VKNILEEKESITPANEMMMPQGGVSGKHTKTTAGGIRSKQEKGG
jgi:hypothetical protein